MALSVVLGVLFAASGQYFLRDLPSETPDDVGATNLVAAPRFEGSTGLAADTTSSTLSSSTIDPPGTSTPAPFPGEPSDPDGASGNSSTNSASTPNERNSSTNSRVTGETAAGEQDGTAEPSTRDERNAAGEPPARDEAPAARDDARAAQVVDLVNDVRSRAGCGPVSTDSRLIAAAQGHSDDMSARGYFSHTTPEGVGFAERARRAGYSSPGAENIARGPAEPEAVMRMWMESPGHRANILNCDLNTIGVGVTPNGWYWTQVFGY